MRNRSDPWLLSSSNVVTLIGSPGGGCSRPFISLSSGRWCGRNPSRPGCCAASFTANPRRAAGESTRVDSLEWENRFQFTETASRPYEIGLLFEVQRATRSGEGLELRYGPLLQTQWGRVQGNLNLLFERRLRAETQRPTEFGYQWQLRVHRASGLDVGAQGFGEVGRWDRWAPRAEQSHILGPAAFARLGSDADDPAVEAALLVGTGGAAPRARLRMQALVPF